MIEVIRTGRIYSFNGTEYLAKFPNGDRLVFWSPPWGEMEDDEKDDAAAEYAASRWKTREYQKTTRDKAREKFVKLFGPGPELETFLITHWPEHYL